MVQTDEIQAILMQIAVETDLDEEEKNLNPLDLFRSGHATKSIILCFAWMTACIGFYALTLNTTQLSGDIVMNFALNGVIGNPELHIEHCLKTTFSFGQGLNDQLRYLVNLLQRTNEL